MIRESLLYLLAGLAARAASFIMIPFYTAHLSPSDYGTIELIELATQVVSLAIGLNIFGNSLIRFYQGETSPEKQKTVVSTAALATAAINAAAVLAAIGLVHRYGPARLPSGDLVVLLELALVSMFFGNVAELCLCYLRLQKRAGAFLAYSLFVLSSTVALNVYLIGYRGRGIFGFVETKLLVLGPAALVLLVWTLRQSGLHWNSGMFSGMAKFGSPLILANVAFFVIHFCDRFFLNHYATLADVGRYALAYKAGFLVTYLVAEPFSRAWSVRFVAMTRNEGWQEQFRMVARIYAAVLAAVAVFLALASEEAVELLTAPAYHAAASVIPVVALAYVFREIGDYCRHLLFINFRSPWVGSVSTGTACLNLLLNWLLIPPYGMYGAAWATVATWCVYAVLLFWLAERDLACGLPGSRLATIVACAGLWMIAGRFAPDGSLLARMAVDACLMGLFLLLLWRSGILEDGDRRLLREKAAAARDALHGFLSHTPRSSR